MEITNKRTQHDFSTIKGLYTFRGIITLKDDVIESVNGQIYKNTAHFGGFSYNEVSEKATKTVSSDNKDEISTLDSLVDEVITEIKTMIYDNE